MLHFCRYLCPTPVFSVVFAKISAIISCHFLGDSVWRTESVWMRRSNFSAGLGVGRQIIRCKGGAKKIDSARPFLWSIKARTHMIWLHQNLLSVTNYWWDRRTFTHDSVTLFQLENGNKCSHTLRKKIAPDNQTRDTWQKTIPYSSSRFEFLRVASRQAGRQGLVSSRRNQARTGSGRSIAGTGSCSGTTLLVRKTNLLRTTPAFFLTTLLASNVRAPSWVLSKRDGVMRACDTRYCPITSEVPGSGQFWQGIDFLERTSKAVKELSFIY